MLGRWLRGPDADTVTLEAIGMVKGTEPVGYAGDNQMGRDNANRLASRISKVIHRDGDALDRDQITFLRGAQKGLDQLGEMPSSFPTGRFKLGPVPEASYEIREANPEWGRKYEALRGQLDGQAEALFMEKYQPGIVAEYGDQDRTTLERQAKRDPGLKISMAMGRV
ncbi:MAG: hypothetical protein AAF556_06005 [Pseudomonadota bacterium]